MKTLDLLVVGGGAAGFFAAIRYAERKPGSSITILEKKNRFLEKVKVSGGGRCNVTHDWNTPSSASDYYARGADFLQEAFNSFHCKDMRNWLIKHGVETKVEEDGRVFPTSDNSESIINCFLKTAENYGIKLLTKVGLLGLEKENDTWLISTESGEFHARNVLIATGSNRPVWELMKSLGHQVAAPVASLFAFNAVDKRWADLAGISVSNALISLEKSEYKTSGPLLITHRGFSGPAVLKLSSWAARELEKRNYEFAVRINWLGVSAKECLRRLKELRELEAKKNPALLNPFGLPKRLNQRLFEQLDIQTIKMGELGNKVLIKWAEALSNTQVAIRGKATNKDEFVTCGGIDLGEVDASRMESKLHQGLFFAGEVLDIDAVTGGFNFQACWSGANLAARSMD